MAIFDRPEFMKGSISFKVKNQNSLKNLINFEFPLNESGHFSDLLMEKFSPLTFSRKEKKFLSNEIRKNIWFYNHIDIDLLNTYSDQLRESISHHHDDHMIIETSGFGSFICLHSILSGKIDKNKTIDFHLAEVPLSLFPRQLIKSKVPKNHPVFIHIAPSSWLAPFKSLVTRPFKMRGKFQILISEEIEEALKHCCYQNNRAS